MDKNLALETLKSFIENTDNVIAKDAILALHPELAESENERIRKEIVRIVDIWTNSSPVVNGIPRETLLAYLEKQKEPKQDSLTEHVYSNEDKKFIQDCANILVANNYTRSAERLLSMFGQKPIKWSEGDKQWLNEVYFVIDHSMYSEGERQAMREYIDFLRSQSKPTEQKEQEHSLNFDVVSSWLREHASKYVNREFNEFHKCIEYDGTINVERLIADLKVAVGYTADAPLGQDNNLNLIYPEDLQKSEEWSKEDEMRINEVIETLNIVQENRERTVRTHYSKTAIDKDIDWLHHKFKSLRPQQHWKPNEEQMGALFAASERNDKLGAILLSLYNDLKKL